MEISKIQKQFNQVIGYSQGLEASTDQLFDKWKTNKAPFINMMHGFIYEMPEPVTFELDVDAKEQKLNEFLDWVCSEYGRDMFNFFMDNHDGIFDNKLVIPCDEFPKGMKLSKVLMKKFGLDAEDVRQKLSMLIQSNKVTGKFCLSVHPLDFLSASENNHGWRSCHALDGEYRAGNVSYMVDKVTIMAYLKSDKDVVLPRFPANVAWNDKKWRCYFFCDKENSLIYAGRQYPFHSNAALEIAAKLFANMFFFDEDFKTEWEKRQESYRAYNYPVDEHPYVHPFLHRCLKADTVINGEHWNFTQTKMIVGHEDSLRIVPLKYYVKTHEDALCYNDLLDSHLYAPYVMTYDDGPTYIPIPAEMTKPLVIGESFNCLCCGRHLPKDSDTFFCSTCIEGEDEEEENEDVDPEPRPWRPFWQ